MRVHLGLDRLEVQVAQDALEVDFGGDLQQLRLALSVVNGQPLQRLRQQVHV